MDTPQTAASLPSRRAQFIELMGHMIAAVGKLNHEVVRDIRLRLMKEFEAEVQQIVFYGVDPSRIQSRAETQVYLLFPEWLAASVFEKAHNRHKIRTNQDSEDIVDDCFRKALQYFRKPKPKFKTSLDLEKFLETCVTNMFNTHKKAMKKRATINSYAELEDNFSYSGLNTKRPRQRKTHAKKIAPTQPTRPELPEEIYIIIPPRTVASQGDALTH